MKKYILKGAVLFLLVGSSLLLPQSFVLADSSAWNSGGDIAIHDSYKELRYSEFDAFWQSYMGLHGRQDCNDQYLAMASSILVEYCWYSSWFGLTSPYGNVIRPEGASYAGLLGEFAQKRLIPTPNEDVFIELTPQDYGFSVQFRTLSQTQVAVLRQDGDYLFYDFTVQPTLRLNDSAANPYIVDDNVTAIGVWYEKNGRYMLLVDAAVGTVSRIDLETFQIVTTTYVLPEDGDDRFATFDITSDGKFIIANVLGHEPRLINLVSCESEEYSYINQPALCSKRLLGNTINDFDSNTGGLGSFAIFEDDTTIAFYTSVGQEFYSKFLLFAPGTWQSGDAYIALGDSFASGEGSGNYYEGTDNIDGNMCHLSKDSYPFLLGRELGLSDTRSVACSGAKIQNISGQEIIDNEEKDPNRSNQYDKREEDSDLGIWTPGRGLQSQYILDNQPDIITISIGGNDMHFGNVVEDCVSPFRKEQTCYLSKTERSRLVNSMNDQYSRLVDTFRELQKGANLGARIYVIGYPSTLKAGGHCSFNVKANLEEIEFLEAYTAYANTIIEKAAQRAGVTYIDMTTALWGHRLCEESQSAMNGLTLYGHSERRFINPDSYHPNKLGHQLFARHIREATDNFTKANPRPNINETGPNVYDAIYAGMFDSVDEALEGGYIYYYQMLTGRVVERGEGITIRLLQSQYKTAPGERYEYWMHSDPLYLGEGVADNEGTIEATITIPENTPTGRHTLKVIGKNVEGEDVEIRANIYVAFSEDDWDGDGVRNDQQICPIAIQGATVEQQREWCGKGVVEEEPSEPHDHKFFFKDEYTKGVKKIVDHMRSYSTSGIKSMLFLVVKSILGALFSVIFTTSTLVH